MYSVFYLIGAVVLVPAALPPTGDPGPAERRAPPRGPHPRGRPPRPRRSLLAALPFVL